MNNCPDSFDYELDSYLMRQAREDCRRPRCAKCDETIDEDGCYSIDEVNFYHKDCFVQHCLLLYEVETPID